MAAGYRAQVELLLRVLPFVSREQCFALKGGTAINMFVRPMPRLSVDIDLTYLPLRGRDEALAEIQAALDRIRQAAVRTIPRASAIMSPLLVAPKLVVQVPGAAIKVEPNAVLRGALFEVEMRTLVPEASGEFGVYVETPVLGLPDLFGGKIVAALDRQHPRDLFDVKLQLDAGGLTADIRRATVVYLASSDRPMAELLAPVRKPIADTYARELEGMTRIPVSLTHLEAARERLIAELTGELTTEERHFLLSMKLGEPDWTLLPFPNLAELPALRWKLANIRKLAQNVKAHRKAVEALQRVLGI